MCGIYGTTLSYSKDIVRQKLNRIQFRGPDFTGLKEYLVRDDRIVFGHVRLSIIDLDERSNQPFDFSSNTSIVFNGEIYNYKELAKTYLNDVKLSTSSDTEVICAMYEKFGTNCIQYFNGMFSFVLYDRTKNILFGARDRLGIKPLYYYLSANGFEFSSQLSAIEIGNDLTIDPLSRSLYLYMGYIPDPYSIYKEVKKIEAGFYFEYDITTKSFTQKRYWDVFDNTTKFSMPKSYEEAKECLKELLLDSVKLRLYADVPVGVFLSGGIDSSLVAAIASKYNPKIEGYTIGFRENEYNESKYAIKVSEALSIPVHVDICDEDEAYDILRDYTHYFDEPFSDPSLVPSSLVAQKASTHIKAVIGGDGGDEFFWGYSWYPILKNRNWQFSNRIVRFALKEGSKFSKRTSKKSSMFNAHSVYDAYKYFNRSNYYGAEKYDPETLADSMPYSEYLNSSRGPLCFSDYDMKLFMCSQINTKTDRATMRSSLELRSPIMDYRIAEYSRLLPFEYVYDEQLGQKRIIKDILYDFLPESLFERKKQGFGAPINEWLKTSLRSRLTELISCDNLKQFLPELDSDRIMELRKRFLEGDNTFGLPMWHLFTYLNWVYYKKTSTGIVL